MNFDDATGLLNAERHLRFHALAAAPEQNDLTLIVDGATVSETETPAGTGDARVDQILGPVRAIETGPGCLRYTIRFSPCIAYLWRDESFVIPEQDEDFSLKLRRYDHSAYLDFVHAATFAADAAGYPLEHFAVITLDAVVDVICREAPVVSAQMLDPDDPGAEPTRPADQT